MSIKNVHNEAFAIVIGDWHFNSLGLIEALAKKGLPFIKAYNKVTELVVSLLTKTI